MSGVIRCVCPNLYTQGETIVPVGNDFGCSASSVIFLPANASDPLGAGLWLMDSGPVPACNSPQGCWDQCFYCDGSRRYNSAVSTCASVLHCDHTAATHLLFPPSSLAHILSAAPMRRACKCPRLSRSLPGHPDLGRVLAGSWTPPCHAPGIGVSSSQHKPHKPGRGARHARSISHRCVCCCVLLSMCVCVPRTSSSPEGLYLLTASYGTSKPKTIIAICSAGMQASRENNPSLSLVVGVGWPYRPWHTITTQLIVTPALPTGFSVNRNQLVAFSWTPAP